MILPTLHEIVSFDSNIKATLDRRHDALAWAKDHCSGSVTDPLTLHIRAITACLDAAMELGACGSLDSASRLRALAAWHIAKIDRERTLQEHHGLILP